MKDMLRWELGGPFQGLVRGSLSFLGLRLQHVPIPCLFVGGKMRVVLVVPGVGTICQLRYTGEALLLGGDRRFLRILFGRRFVWSWEGVC